MRRGSGLALAAWAAYLTLANFAWLRAQLSAHPPNWDRALYLYLGVRYLNAYRDGGLFALAAEFVQRSTTVAPLFPLSTLPGYLAFGESRLVAHATTSLYLLVLLAALYALGRSLYDPATGLLAAFVLSSCAGITLASRDYMLDMPAAALATAAVALLVLSDFGRRLRSALGFGILLGLTVLTKTMAAVFLVGPLAEALWRARRDPQRARSLALGLLAALLIASTWWGPNHAAALAYLWRYGFSEAARPFASGGESLLTLRNIGYYPAALVNEGVGPILAALLAAAGLLLLRLRLRGRPLPFGDAFLLRWLGISLAILTAVPNKSGARYSLGLLPPVALLLAGAVAKLESRGGRRLAVLALALAGLHSHAALTYDVGLPRLYYHLSTGLVAVHPLAPRSRGTGDVENPWPVRELLDLATAEAGRQRVELGRRASSSPASLLRAAGLPPAEIVREAYLKLLKRAPDQAGLAAYVRELERGSLTPEGLLRGIAGSAEFRDRPERVLVVTNHPFLNASVLRYYAERARLPLTFEHLEGSLPPSAVADLYDLAVLKRGGDQGPGHTTLLMRPLEFQILGEGASWRPLPSRLACPDGSVVVVLASGPA